MENQEPDRDGAHWSFILRATLATLCALGGLAVFTLPRAWFENDTGLEPDHGNGSLEMLIGIGLLVASTVLTVGAIRSYRRTRREGGSGSAVRWSDVASGGRRAGSPRRSRIPRP
jgi:hypothetical protein